MPEPLTYLDRKTAEPPLCTYPGCRNAPALGVQLCPRHRRKQNRRQAESARRLTAGRRRAGLCASPGCGAKSETYYCIACAISKGRLSTVAPDNTLDKQARLAARTKVDPTGRTRYHGQDRTGTPPASLRDAQDVAEMHRLLKMCGDGLVMARAAVGLSKVQLRAAFHAALAHGDRAARLFEDMATRYGYTQQMLVPDRDE